MDSVGLCCYIKQEYSKYVELYTVTNNDDIIWLKFSKSLFDTDSDVYFCLCYVVLQSSSRENVVDISVFDRISTEIVKISNKFNHMCNFIVHGDISSREGSLKDFVENYHTNPHAFDFSQKITSQLSDENYPTQFCK